MPKEIIKEATNKNLKFFERKNFDESFNFDNKTFTNEDFNNQKFGNRNFIGNLDYNKAKEFQQFKNW